MQALTHDQWSEVAHTFRLMPLRFARWLWPWVTFYREQRLFIESVVYNYETYVPAANKVGKDFGAGFIIVHWLLTRWPFRILTTSASDDHLSVLWGETNRFIETAEMPLLSKQGGPLVVNHQHIRIVRDGRICPISYAIGMVANDQNIAKMGGHHANPTDLEMANDGVPRTLFVADECSSVRDGYRDVARGWYQRGLFIGNTWPCENFWKKDVTAGDLPRQRGHGFHRKVIHIKAKDSPNIRLGLEEERLGREPSNRLVVPGVKPYEEYCNNLVMLDPIQKSVILEAEFYEGAELKLFPSRWLDLAAYYGETLRGRKRLAKGIGVDPAERGNNTTVCAVDEDGVIELVTLKTPDTNVIAPLVLEFMKKHGCEPNNVCFDRGGGGKQAADRLRAMGYNVRTVGFGETISLDPKRGLHMLRTRLDTKEEKYTYLNRRAQMYGDLSELLEPDSEEKSRFGIPKEYNPLYLQLKVIPKWYDGEGRLYLPPKHNDPDEVNPDKKITISKLIGGGSPDEADALVLAVHAMLHKKPVARAGAV